ncbi:MAG TPA: hypothetical protein VJR89_38525 [Polyangiales bacterium]|nr:hypothetical protein [Polyangiales bacterium]
MSCGSAAPVADDALALGQRFGSDAEFRRGVLEQSLAVHDNDYARLRLVHYARDWDALPEWNPRVAPWLAGDVPLEPVWTASAPGTREEWLALGKAAFERWPAQRMAALSAARAAALGIASGAVVRVAYTSGVEEAALSCAGCHAARGPDGELQPGPPSDVDLAGWGAGRVDVTGDDVENPVAIPDLRAVAHQRRLHWTGNLHNGLLELAVRIETLLITAASSAVRPPREIAFALALYVESLGDEETSRELAASPRGAAVFERECGRCHAHATGAGDVVSAEEVGTDPTAAVSPERGGAGYRVPSLFRVGERRRLLHDGSIERLDELLQPHAGGHRFGVELTADDRASLLVFLRSL